MVRCIGRDVGGFSCAQDRFSATEGDLYLAHQNGKHFLEIVAMRRRAAAWGNQHVDEAIATRSVRAREKNRIGATRQSDVWQGLNFFRPCDGQISLEIIKWNGRVCRCHVPFTFWSSCRAVSNRFRTIATELQ